jgi:hypothetical protein
VSKEEDLIRSTTRAIASAVRQVPPLRLDPAADELRSPARPARRGQAAVRRGLGREPGGRPPRWRAWAAPLTAAAVVVALAVVLVVVKDVPDGSAAHPNATTAAGPDGAPRYYAAVTQFSGSVKFANGKQTNTVQDGVVVEDSVTGQRIAKFAPPKHTTFQTVMAAADDRTFVVLAVTSPTGSFATFSQGGPTLTGRWYEVKLTPGAAQPARLTLLPIKPWSWGPDHSVHDYTIPAPGKVFATALSQDGTELAVADTPPLPAGDLDTAQNWQEVKVFSVATGQLLHDWTEHDPLAAFGETDWWVPSLTWVDGDRALLLVTALPARPQTGTVRRVNVSGPARGDLMADSTVVWSAPLTAGSGYGCYAIDSWPPLISADGKTVSCMNYDEVKAGPSNWMVSFVTDPLPSVAATGIKPRFDYQVKSPLDKNGKPLAEGAETSLFWVSPSGDTQIGMFHYIESRPPATGVHFGVISHGKFTPLRVPSSLGIAQPGQIAW